MKCIDPVLCYTDGIKRRFRHFSLANPVFRAIHNQVFDCRKCIACRKKYAKELALRCVLHASLYDQNSFLTLTYDESLPTYHNNFDYSDIQNFKKRLRAHCDYHFGKKIQIFNVHEYGRHGKKHWHLVLFNHSFDEDKISCPKSGYFNSPSLAKRWPFGFHSIGDVNEASAMYQAQYMQKDVKYGHLGTEKISHSRHAGIGRDYFLRHYKQILMLGFVPFKGEKRPVPRYFEKLAHKHYSHFYEPANFLDTDKRKRLYTPFKPGFENKEIADLFKAYRSEKDIIVEQLTAEWEEQIQPYIYTKEKPDFVKSGENVLYDLRNKIINKNSL